MTKQIAEYWMAPELASRYHMYRDEKCTVWCIGVMAYAEEEDDDAVLYDVLQIAHLALENALDFNKLYGFYKIVVLDLLSDTTMFWGDNAGSCRFYYHLQEGCVADTLPLCTEMLQGDIHPCYEAIYQYFSMGRTLDDQTIVDGIRMTSQRDIYVRKGNVIRLISKQLAPYQALDPHFTLEKLMRMMRDGIKGKPVMAVITGGTDSRCILSHLAALEVVPQLTISGREASNDVRIARKIAEQCGLPLHVYDPNQKETSWIHKAFAFSNGVYDVVLSYRHLKRAEHCLETGAEYEFGGVGGEFYKNCFCLPFRHAQWFRKLTAKDIVTKTIGSKLMGASWYGPNIMSAKNMLYDHLINIQSQNMESGFLRNYNKFGEIMLAGTFCNVTVILLPYCTKIDPLMDRNLIASVCWKNPLSLSMARWQRKEIHAHCPALSDIETDLGYSCSVREITILRESLRKLQKYAQVAVNKVQRMIKKGQKSEATVWEQDYLDAKVLPEYERAVLVCKELGIIGQQIAPESLPTNQVGFVLMVGMFFDKYHVTQ
ncbi:MAG: hypothetical protein RR224_12170 [Clostridia bacterium]